MTFYDFELKVNGLFNGFQLREVDLDGNPDNDSRIMCQQAKRVSQPRALHSYTYWQIVFIHRKQGLYQD